MKRLVIAFACASITALGAQADGHDVFGTWVTEAGTSHVEIADCGDGTPCGTVAWIDATALEPGVTPETAVDDNGDKVLGLKMLYGFSKKKKDWRSGKIYDPEGGKTYGAQLKLQDDGTLRLKGCLGPFCQTQIWQRAAAPRPATES